ncbi:hypothetical protein [Pseudomonas sp. BBP2017]|uniref:hypothetical protein n=1 Tax=Pseudomonas sp. BBP2017 TaxID=2109731 RepID=UPI001304FAF8|nr:hypothetical protein [Pseudomonas sp. BBP2017]
MTNLGVMGTVVRKRRCPVGRQALYEKCLRVDHAALKTGSECSFTISKLRFLACFRHA